jgi:DNA-binding NtrC family response regulator
MMKDAKPYPVVLLVEDSRADAALITSQVKAVWPNCNVLLVDTLSKAYDIYRTTKVNIFLLDLNLPDGFGARSVEEVMAFSRQVPVVVITGMGTQMTANEALRHGAKTVVFKDKIMTDSFKTILIDSLRG